MRVNPLLRGRKTMPSLGNSPMRYYCKKKIKQLKNRIEKSSVLRINLYSTTVQYNISSDSVLQSSLGLHDLLNRVEYL
jgi:hypothetical protein